MIMIRKVCPNCGHICEGYSYGVDEKMRNILTLLTTGTVQINDKVDAYYSHHESSCLEVGGKKEYLLSNAYRFARYGGEENLRVISKDTRREHEHGMVYEYRTTTFAPAPDVSIIGFLPALFRYSKEIGYGTYACPICGTTPLKKAEVDSDLEVFFQEEAPAIVDKIKHGIPIPVGIRPNGPVDLCAFLRHLLHLEANLYSLEQVLEQVIIKQRNLEHKKRMAAVGLPMIEKARQTHIRSELTQKIKDAESALQNIPVQMPFVSETVSDVCVAEQNPQYPELKKAWLFNKARVEAENAMLIHDYEEKKAKYDSAYQKALLEEQKRRKAQNKQIAEQRATEKAKLRELLSSLRKQLNGDSSSKFINPYTELHNWSKKEVQDIKDKIQELCVARAKLLATGILHVKYADIVAISTILEYLETGRCTQLEGHEGAYNLYESEIRADRIIAQLDQVIDSLEYIKRVQYYTYEVMTKIQRNTQAISQKMDSAISTLNKISEDIGAIRETSELIAYNTEKTAYYAKMNAELTDALGYMAAF